MGEPEGGLGEQEKGLLGRHAREVDGALIRVKYA